MQKLLDHDLGFLVHFLQLRHCRQPLRHSHFTICHPPLIYLHFTFYIVGPFEESHIFILRCRPLWRISLFTLSLLSSLSNLTFFVLAICDLHFLKLIRKLQNKFSSRRWKWLIGQFFHLLSDSPSPCLDLTPGKNIELFYFTLFIWFWAPLLEKKVI